MTTKFSLKEAAAIADVPEKAIRKSIEDLTIQPERLIVGRTTRHRFDARDLVYLKMMSEIRLRLRQDDKRALYDIIERKHESSGDWYSSGSAVYTKLGDLEMRIDLRYLKESLVRRLRSFLRGRRRIVSRADVLSGEPVFEGTRIPLSHITGLLAKKVPLDEIKEDYPSLSSSDLEYAAMVARMKPNPGRPRKPLVLMRDGRSVTTIDRALSVGEAPSR